MRILICSLMLLLSAAPARAAAPAIAPEKPLFDFGLIAEGVKLEHTFRFKNNGDAPLIIEKVRSSCGCTAALLSAKTIQPGKAGEVKTVFDSNGFSGSVIKTIYLHTNDPVQKTVRFQLQGQVQKELVVRPSRIRFAHLKKEVPSKASITLTNKGKTTLFLSDLKTTGPELSATLPVEQLEPDETVEMVITLTPAKGKSRFAGYITLRTSSPRTPQIRISVTGNPLD